MESVGVWGILIGVIVKGSSVWWLFDILLGITAFSTIHRYQLIITNTSTFTIFICIGKPTLNDDKSNHTNRLSECHRAGSYRAEEASGKGGHSSCSTSYSSHKSTNALFASSSYLTSTLLTSPVLYEYCMKSHLTRYPFTFSIPKSIL